MSISRTYSQKVSELIVRFDFRLKKELSVPVSPVPHLLDCNSAPSAEDRQSIENVLFIARKRANRLQERLGRKTGLPNSTRLQILRTLENIESFIHTHESILSTLRILPNEILALIFIFCLPDVQSEPWQERKWKSVPSLRLSQVCGNWRDLAINTPQLWTILGDITVNAETAKDGENPYLNFLEGLLGRSRELSLWIFMSSPVANYAPDRHPVIDALMKHEPRWAALGIYGAPFMIKAICDPARPIPASFSKLQKLYLNVTWHLASDIGVIKMTKAPLLTEVTLPNLLHDKVLLPFNKLRIYREKLSSFHVSQKQTLVQAVIHGRNLQTLEILANQHLPCSDQLSTTTIVLERLTTLSLTIDNVSSIAQLSKSFLNTLSLPCLEEFRAAGFGEYQPLFIASFIKHAIPNGSGSPLRKLFLRNMTFRQGSLSRLLEVTPNIEELDIDFPPDEDLNNLIRGRADGESSAPLLVPRLRGIILNLPKHVNSGRPTKRKDSILALAQALTNREIKMEGLELRTRAGGSYFCLGLSDPTNARALQVDLNFQNYNAGGYSPEPDPGSDGNMGLRDKFFSWRSRIIQALPELGKDELPLTKRTYFNAGFPSDFDDLLREIEMLDLGTGRQVANLYVTGLHFPLLYLGISEDGYIPGDRIYTFRSRAKRILKKWDRVIEADLKTRRIPWVLKGLRTLVYVGQEDEWHVSSARKKTVYFGLEDYTVTFEALKWPEDIV
ncbi:hypothetical protein CPB84DRAFT_1822334 [Gymnopilus junonius]|uniref:F-box domain-containing protein n=1 Tax=Gymnopilus junonius TaxID=109634 RepID=A0A9P5NWP8_GYMJU|nr:hypothetical protein CPB84DRAFT_1822334 [Gymnopilus junonius]